MTASRLQLVIIRKVKIILSLMLTRAIESISAFTVGMTFAVVHGQNRTECSEAGIERTSLLIWNVEMIVYFEMSRSSHH